MDRGAATVARVRRPGFGEFRPGDHIAFIHEDTSELLAFVVSFVRDGLAEGERCVTVVDELAPAELTAALRAGGVDVDREVERGALVVLSVQEYYGPPPFDALRVIELTRKRVTEAISHGFSGLRVAVEMTWAPKLRCDDALLGYESLLDRAIGPGPLTAACMYRRDRFHPAALQQLVRSHGKVVAGDHVFLNLSALFQNLARSDLQKLLQSAHERHVPVGRFYFHQGDEATEVFVLTTGKVKLVRTDPDGRNVILRIVAPPEPFGEHGALGGTTRLASAQALEDSRALVWDAPTIVQTMMKHPAVALNAVRLMEERLAEEWGRLEDLATSRVERRLARLLLRLGQSIGRKASSHVAIELALSGRDFAELAGTTVYTVSRILAEWKRLGMVEVGRKRVLILDQKRLSAIAGVGAP